MRTEKEEKSGNSLVSLLSLICLKGRLHGPFPPNLFPANHHRRRVPRRPQRYLWRRPRRLHHHSACPLAARSVAHYHLHELFPKRHFQLIDMGKMAESFPAAQVRIAQNTRAHPEVATLDQIVATRTRPQRQSLAKKAWNSRPILNHIMYN